MIPASKDLSVAVITAGLSLQRHLGEAADLPGLLVRCLASRRLESILKKYNKPSQLRKLKAQLRLLIKNYGETSAGKRASEIVKKMRG